MHSIWTALAAIIVISAVVGATFNAFEWTAAERYSTDNTRVD